MKKQLQKGFTLIELMIVVAIIGILASIALPAYQTYVAKSNITSIQASAAAAKTEVWQHYIDNGKMEAPSATVTPGLFAVMGATAATSALPGQSTTAFAVSNDGTGTDNALTATVTLTGINGNVNTNTIAFAFIDDGDALKFTCTSAIDPKYLPNQCTP